MTSRSSHACEHTMPSRSAPAQEPSSTSNAPASYPNASISEDNSSSATTSTPAGVRTRR